MKGDISTYAGIESQCRGQVIRNEPLARYTSLGIGGPADLFVLPRDLDDLRNVMELAEGIPVLVIGRGTNLLISDQGFRGVVIKLSHAFGEIKVRGDVVSVGAGLGLQDLVHFCAEQGLGGLELATGIPGTVGGAVKTNAGTATEAVGDRISRVELVGRRGGLVSLGKAELNFRYRGSFLPDGGVIYRVEFQLWESNPRDIRAKMGELLDQRRKSQPLSEPNVGCIFKNPEEDSAGRLIEQCGCKGMRIGGAVISQRHANFILNLGGAGFDDVARLINVVRERVYRLTGVSLELEVEVIT